MKKDSDIAAQLAPSPSLQCAECMVMWVVSVTVTRTVRVIVGFKCHGMNGLFIYVHKG